LLWVVDVVEGEGEERGRARERERREEGGRNR
jgi:hypothetical protein